jgi:hypothetical protein
MPGLPGSVAKPCKRGNSDLSERGALFEPSYARKLKQFPAYLNRWDSQQARNEGVFAH